MRSLSNFQLCIGTQHQSSKEVYSLRSSKVVKSTMDNIDKRLTVSNALNGLAKTEGLFQELFKHGSLSIEIYKPNKVDKQSPHSQDELYVIASGSGSFINDGVLQEIEIGEVLFVPAGKEHRFVDFSDDFSTWVFFYGPEGGEQNV